MSERYEVGKARASGRQAGLEDAKPAQRPRAVFVAHGMGQQVPFATLDDVAKGICENAKAKVRTTRARTVRVGCDVVQRLEIEFENDAVRPIHIFEAYWAPLTEGAVGLWQVVRFLLLGGWNGIRSGGRFHRFLFGKSRDFRIRPLNTLFLLFAIVVVLAIVITGCAVAIAGAAWLLGFDWVPDALKHDLTAAFELLLAVLIAAGLVSAVSVSLGRVVAFLAPLLRAVTVAAGLVLAAAFILTAFVRIPLSILFNEEMPFGALWHCDPCRWSVGTALRARVGTALEWAHRNLQEVCVVETWLWWMLLAAAVAAVAIAAFHALRRTRNAKKNGTDAHCHEGGQWWGFVVAAAALLLVIAMCGRSDAIALATWILLLAFVLFVRRFLIQYVGDVAAYVSPHVVDRFFDLRHRIKDRVWRAARAVYALREDEGFLYDEVAVVGHSLGSVIVYDALNRLLNDDEMAENVAAGERCGDLAVEVLGVAKRTKLLLTFGSPLDKTAFVFAMHDRCGGTDRDALATSVQPLIRDERALTWINVSSRWDIISGPLDFYDTPEKDNAKIVDNRLDSAATTPLAAHVEYWKGTAIYEAILEHLPA